ncbi:putative exported uslfatase [Lentisphaera araneosa HTCC2155]|uniref:Putative exported uslfatase n=1 Tax=Lentisphaera araneosa HTCC2155 TaxID=313628 RepID=A6DTF3_9BACT|nr:sulfatase [Lentisphaera araneosa]EDM25057.1 putative exported uslfatase [Lentisphaera araneosa HTCC2155]
MKYFIFFASFITIHIQSATEKPNFLFILIDDLGRQDLNCYGSKFYETPHINQLAEEGTLFTDAYSASPVCSPTRASIQTGKYPSRINFTRATPTHNLPYEETTLAEALQAFGYKTAHMGKWHMRLYKEKGHKHLPTEHGFDINIGGHSAGQPASFFYPYKAKHDKYRKNDVPHMEDGKKGDYLTDALTDKAINFMKDNQDQPFYLNLCYYTVHTPVTGKKDKVKKYEEKLKKISANQQSSSTQDYVTFARDKQDNAEYAAMVESMDENIGRLNKFLKQSGLDKNTVVIFTSDNGGLSTNKNPKAGPTSSFPLRGGKAWVYEGGIRVPLIIKWPESTQAGSEISSPVISTDFYPTILSMADLALKPKQHLDGLDLTALLKAETQNLNREELHFHFPHDHNVNGMGASSAVRVGHYKLVERFSNGKLELFNLKNDPGETNNLSAEYPELTKELHKKMQKWRIETQSMIAKSKEN